MIYLDYNATTPIDKEVADTMRPYLYEHFGNPSSSHALGKKMSRAVENARSQVANLIGCQSDEIIFTSGGTESNNIAIRGVAQARADVGKHIITSAIEHPATIQVCKYVEKHGWQISIIPVDEYGTIKLDELEKVISPETTLMTIMHANNEVGTIQPISEIAEIVKSKRIAFHTDAAQSVGKIPVRVDELGVDLLSIAGHKIYAPAGIGALYCKRGLKIEKLMFGAGHELDRRAGTENVLGIVGLGKACEIAANNLQENKKHMQEMRDLLQAKCKEKVLDFQFNGHPTNCLPNTLSLGFKNIRSSDLLEKIQDKLAVSPGSACHTDSIKLSAVLEAMNTPMEYGMGAVRFSVGRKTSEQDVCEAAEIITETILDLQNN